MGSILTGVGRFSLDRVMVTSQRALPGLARRAVFPVGPSNLLRSHVVELFEVVSDADKLYIVQECLNGGELFEQIIARGPFAEAEALAIFAQVGMPQSFSIGRPFAHIQHRCICMAHMQHFSVGMPHPEPSRCLTCPLWRRRLRWLWSTCMACACGIEPANHSCSP